MGIHTMSDIYGSEQGWAEASHDSRRAMKQADIKRTVDKLQANIKSQRAAHESAMEADYLEGAMDLANAMQGNRSFGYSRRYSANYDKVFKER